MDLLLINPNTTEAITQMVAGVVRALTPPGVSVRAVTAAFGPRYIASRSTFAVASHGALDAYARHGEGADAVLLACYGDPGLDAIREVSPVPVIGLVEAAAHEASAQGRRFAIVTGGVLWEPMLRDMHRARGLDGALAAIRTVAPSGAAIAADPDGSIALLADACRRAVEDDGAQAVVLGGAGLVGLAARVQEMVGAPVICSVEAGVRAALRALEERPGASAAPGPIDSIGLSPDLSRLLNSDRA